MKLLDSLYDTTVKGIGRESTQKGRLPVNMVQPVDTIAHNYLSKQSSIEAAAKSFIKYQIAKYSTTGFLTGLSGILNLPIALPANIASALFIQLQTITTLAKMSGFDVQSAQVRTLAYMCLADLSVEQVFKQTGIQIVNAWR